MSRIINVGIMSYGMSGSVFHAPFIHLHSGFKLVAVVERSIKKASERYPDIISYNNVDEIIADPLIDLIIINTPNYTHFDFAKRCLYAGKDVLLEKPFTVSVEEAKLLFDLARLLNRNIFCYQNRRYDSGFKQTKEIIDSGCLGKLNEVYFRFDRYRNAIGVKAFKEDSIYQGSGLLYDLGPHLIDQAIALFGIPINYYKVSAKNRVDSKVDDYFFIHLSYPNQLNVYLTATMLAAAIPPAFVLNGTLGSFSKNHGDVQEAQLLAGFLPNNDTFGKENISDSGILTLVTQDGGRSIMQLPSLKGDYIGIFDALYNSIVFGVAYPITEEQILKQLEIIEA